jgi:putative Holliday junction resolvase
MRYLGLDVGDRWIGVALSDPSGKLASPLTIIKRSEEMADLEAIVGVINQHNVGRVIVGLPRSMDGSLGVQAEKVADFTRKLGKHTEIPIEFRDERLTTKLARRLMQASRTRKSQGKRDDAVAAAVLLQSFLDEECG